MTCGLMLRKHWGKLTEFYHFTNRKNFLPHLMGTNVNRTFPILWLEGLHRGGDTTVQFVKPVLEHILRRESYG